MRPTGAVVVSSVGISAKNGWQLVPYTTDMAHAKGQTRSCSVSKSTIRADEATPAMPETFALSSPWEITENGRLPIDYDAVVVCAVSKPVTEQEVLCVVFVLEWRRGLSCMEEQKAVEQMTVLMVEPGLCAIRKDHSERRLEAKQELVGGLITAIYPYEEMVAIVANDEGILLNMEFNRSVEGGYGGVWWVLFSCAV